MKKELGVNNLLCCLR